MSRCWDYDDDIDPYWKHRLEEAEDAMNDREVGLIGQCQAARDYDEISRKLGLTSRPTRFFDCNEEEPVASSKKAEEEVQEEKQEPKFSRGLPIISW